MAADISHTSQQLTPILGADAEALISLNQKLTSLGIADTIKLPTLVCLGDQSTGKSSLIEAISTIKVPKAAGLCTRNPLRIQLSSGRPPLREWECSVSIEERYMYDKSNKRISKANPFGPWKPLPEPSTTLVETIQDQDKLLDLINLAQSLVLNPNREQGSVHESSTENLERFSPNIILINISFGNCPNLSFVDLPGVIQVSERGAPEYYTRLVENLARQWARDESACVLLVLPMVHDVSNSKSYAIIQSEEAQGRCMAVFTKPDLAQEEQRQDYLTRYFGEESEEEFEYGHRVVMLQSAVDSANNGAEAEASFFSQKPWNALPAATKKRFGVRNLISLLREILFQKTHQALPENLTKVRDRITQVQDKLETMPAPPDANALPYQLEKEITTFERNVEQLFVPGHYISGVSSRNKLMEIMRAFDKRIQAEAPTLVCRSEAEREQLSEAQELLNESPTSEMVAVNQNNAVGATNSPVPKTQNKTTKGPHRFTLEEINKLNRDLYQSSIPGDIELRAVEEMRLRSVESWCGTFELVMRRIGKTTQSEILQCLHNTFSTLKHLPVYEQIEKITTGYLDEIIHQEQSRLKMFCDAEMKHALSFDDVRLRTAEEEAYRKRSRTRIEKRLEVERTVQKAKGLSSKRKVKELTVDDIGPDPWEVEVRMAAKTTAYYEVASHRFVDSVCLNIFAVLLPQISDREGGLVNHLKHHLGLERIKENQDNIVALMTEDSERENYRRRLLSELEKLKAGYTFISNVSERLRMPRLHAVYHNLQNYDSMLFEDGYIAGEEGGPPNTPGKRRISDADFETGSENQFESPPKRVKSASKTGGNGRQTRLPSRARSVETTDEMDEDEEEN